MHPNDCPSEIRSIEEERKELFTDLFRILINHRTNCDNLESKALACYCYDAVVSTLNQKGIILLDQFVKHISDQNIISIHTIDGYKILMSDTFRCWLLTSGDQDE